LNLSVELAESGVLEKYNVKMIGASLRAIRIAEDRLLFKDVCRKIGLEVPASEVVKDVPTAVKLADQLGYPIVIRPSFTLAARAARSLTTTRNLRMPLRALWMRVRSARL